MDNRRGFLKKLGVGAAAVGVAATPKAKVKDEVEVDGKAEAVWDQWNGTYKGYKLHWTGWKTDPTMAVLIGQWLAWPYDEISKGYMTDEEAGRPYIYSSTPGIVDTYKKGYQFNLTLQPHQRLVEAMNPKLGAEQLAIADQEKEKAFNLLIKKIDKILAKDPYKAVNGVADNVFNSDPLLRGLK